MQNANHFVPILVQAHLLSGAVVSSAASSDQPSRPRARALPLLLLASVLACALYVPPALGADRPGIVKGTVHDAAAGTPLPGANVAVRSTADSSLVGGATTDSTGRFVVDDLPTGQYSVLVSFMGYESSSRLVTLTATDPDQELDPFRLGRTTASMEEATVSAQRPAITIEGSKKVYDFEKAEVALSTKSVVDVLRNLPSVRIDFEDNIHLRGSSAIEIHVNGEPLAMESKALVQYLKSMSGNDVKRVEINTNPSARHDAEGTANIINIVLDEQDGPGWSGGFSTSGGTRPAADGSANLGYGNDAWSLYGSYSYRYNQNEITDALRRRTLAESSSLLLDQSSTREHAYGGHSFNAQIDYTPTENTTLSLTSTGNIHRTDNTRQMSATRTEWDSSRDQTVAQIHDHTTLDQRLSLTRTFEEKKHELSGALQYQRGDRMDEARDESTFGSAPRTLESTGANPHDASLKIDYIRPLDPWTIETGYKGSLRRLNQNYAVSAFNPSEDRFSAAPVRSDDLQYSEQVHAGYGILTRGVGPVDAEVGVRFEHTQTSVVLQDTAADDNTYGNFFPSVNLNYNIASGSRLSLSYTNKVNRPSTFQLSAFSTSDDEYTKFVGNPDLDPEQIHKGELSLVQNLGLGTVTVAPYVSRTTNAIEWTTVRSDSVTVRTFDNYDSNTAYGAELTSSLQFAEDVKANLSGNVFRRLTRGGSLARGNVRESIAWTGRANVTWTPLSDVRLQWSQFYRSPRTTGLGQLESMTRSSLSVEKTFWEENGSLGLRVEDPFNTSEFGYQKRTDNFREHLTRDWTGRSVSISFSYHFGESDRNQRRGSSSGGGGMMMGGG